MGNLQNTFTLLLVYTWAIGFLAFNAGDNIHILLVIAVLTILQRLVNSEKTV